MRSAVHLGYRPDEVRAMIPRDWLLVKRGYDDAAEGARPGANAMSRDDLADLIREFG